jgi:hypothetical protein
MLHTEDLGRMLAITERRLVELEAGLRPGDLDRYGAS